MVSQMTAIIAAKEINIEEMINKSRGTIAYTVFDLNQVPDEGTFRALGEIDGIIKIRQIDHQ